jgi:O-antigen/teichoic acid export membrane protein
MFNILMNQVLSKCISFLTVTLIIRTLGPNYFGDYSFGLAIIGYGGLFVNFGLSTYGSKQVNQLSSKREVAKVVSEIVSLRLLFAVITFIPLLLIYLSTDLYYLPALLILNIKTLTDAVNVEWYFKGVLKNKFMVIATLMQRFAHLGTVLVLYKWFDLEIACITLSVSFIVYTGTQLFMLYKYEKINLTIELLRFSQIKFIANLVWPFFFSGLFSLVLFNMDTIFLKIYTNSELVGYYNSAHRVIDVFSNLRYAIIGVLFPVFSQAYFISPEKLLSKFFSCLKITMAGIIISTTLVNVYAKEIIELLFGESYFSSVRILRYLVFASVMLYANTFISALYNAIGWEKKVFTSVFVAAAINIVLNSLLVSKYQVMGAIGATLGALIFATGLLLIHFPKAVKHINLSFAPPK